MSSTRSHHAERRRLDAPVVRWLAVIAAVLSLGVGVWVSVRSDSPLDFYVYYMAGELISSGESPYDIDRPAWDRLARSLGITHYAWPYRYSPHTAVLTIPLQPLGARGAMVAWTIINAAAFLCGAMLAGSAAGGRRGQVVALVLLTVFGPVYNSFGDGQVEGIAFLGLALAFWALSRRRSLGAGVGVAVATVLKLIPVALVAYLLWRRRWLAAASALAGIVVLTLICLPFSGLGVFTEWAGDAVRLTAPRRINVNPPNQTLTGVIGRLLLDRTMYDTSVRTVTVRALAAVCAAVLVGFTAFATWPRRSQPQLAGFAQPPPIAGDVTGFGMVLAVMLVIGTFTYYHQFSWLLIPAVLIVKEALDRQRVAAVAGWAILIVLMDVDYVLWVTLHDGVLSSGVWRFLSVPFVFAVAVWLSCWKMLRRPVEVPAADGRTAAA